MLEGAELSQEEARSLKWARKNHKLPMTGQRGSWRYFPAGLLVFWVLIELQCLLAE